MKASNFVSEHTVLDVSLKIIHPEALLFCFSDNSVMGLLTFDKSGSAVIFPLFYHSPMIVLVFSPQSRSHEFRNAKGVPFGTPLLLRIFGSESSPDFSPFRMLPPSFVPGHIVPHASMVARIAMYSFPGRRTCTLPLACSAKVVLVISQVSSTSTLYVWFSGRRIS